MGRAEQNSNNDNVPLSENAAETNNPASAKEPSTLYPHTDTAPDKETDEPPDIMVSNDEQEMGEVPKEETAVDQPEIKDNASNEDQRIEEIESDKSPEEKAVESYIYECTKRGTIPMGYFIRNVNVEELIMRHANLSPEDFKPLAIIIGPNQNITHLDLSHNWLGDESVCTLCQMLTENQFITKLVLIGNKLSDCKAEELCDTLASVTQLEWLDLSENGFGDHSATFFGEMISTTLNMQYLNLSKNKFGEDSALLLGRALAQSESLKELDISYNHIRGKQVKQFCQGVAASKLERLNFACNGLGPVNGCKEISLAIKSNQILRELDLSDNRITAEGAIFLGKGLQLNQTLISIKFDRNPLRTAGCYAILNYVVKNVNSKLKVLSFEDIIVNKDFRLLQDKAFTALPNLRVVHGSKSTNEGLKIYSLRSYSSLPPEDIKWKELLKKVHQKTHRNLTEFLNKADEDKDLKLSRQEFTTAIEQYLTTVGLGITGDELRQLLKELDPDNENEVNIE